MAMELNYKDRRSKKIVFVSHCIINCNSKFPGYADVAGAYTDFIIPILRAGIGIYQMPCCEVLGWRGVHRRHIIEDLDRNNLDQEWMENYPRLCAEQAMQTADRLDDYVANGFDVLGIIHVQDSPTCGTNHVDAFPEVHFSLLDSGVTWDDLLFEELIARLETPEELAAGGASGKGAFGSVLRDELIRRGIDVQWLGYVPTKPMKEQAEAILNALGVEIPGR